MIYVLQEYFVQSNIQTVTGIAVISGICPKVGKVFPRGAEAKVGRQKSEWHQ